MPAKGNWSSLKGPALLLFQQWQILNDSPGMKTYDRMWAVFAIYRTIRGQIKTNKEYNESRKIIEKKLHNLFTQYEQFEGTPGAFALKGNEFMDELAGLECDIWDLTVESSLIKDASMPDFTIPFMTGAQ
jgi:hypothetical protein